MYNKFFLIVAFLLPITSHAATIIFGPNSDPNQLKQRGNIYNANNPYDKNNFYHPYGPAQQPYNPESVWNNSHKYSPSIYGPNKQLLGTATGDFRNQNSIVNPYNPAGNPYNQNGLRHGYSPHDNLFGFSTFRNPYDPQSVYNNPAYNKQILDNNGNNIGSIGFHKFNNNQTNDNQNTATDPYSQHGNPYSDTGAKNFYGNPSQNDQNY